MKRIVLVALLLVVIALGAGGTWLWRQSLRPPEWYEPAARGPEVAQAAERVEYRLVEEFQRIRPDDAPWTIRIYEEHVNAWLAERLPEWLAHESGGTWPDELGSPQVNITPDGIEMAIPVRAVEAAGRIAVARLRPSVRAGELHLAVERLGFGRARLPGRTGLSWIESALPPALPDASGLGADLWTAILQGGAMPPEIGLADDRMIEVLGITLVENALELTCRTRAKAAD